MNKKGIKTALILANLGLCFGTLVGCGDEKSPEQEVIGKTVNLKFINGDKLKNSYINDFIEQESIKEISGNKFSKQISYDKGINLDKIEIKNNGKVIAFENDKNTRILSFEVDLSEKINNLEINLANVEVSYISYEIYEEVNNISKYAVILDDDENYKIDKINPENFDFIDAKGGDKIQIPAGKRFFLLAKERIYKLEMITDDGQVKPINVVNKTNNVREKYKYNNHYFYLCDAQFDSNVEHKIQLKDFERSNQYLPYVMLVENKSSRMFEATVMPNANQCTETYDEGSFESYTINGENIKLAFSTSNYNENTEKSGRMFYLGDKEFAVQDDLLMVNSPSSYRDIARGFGKDCYIRVKIKNDMPLENLEARILDGDSNKILERINLTDFLDTNVTNTKVYKISQEKLKSYAKNDTLKGAHFINGHITVEIAIKDEKIDDNIVIFKFKNTKNCNSYKATDFYYYDPDFAFYSRNEQLVDGEHVVILTKDEWIAHNQLSFGVGDLWPHDYVDKIYESYDIKINGIKVSSGVFTPGDENEKDVKVSNISKFSDRNEYTIEVNLELAKENNKFELSFEKLDLTNFDYYVLNYYPTSGEDFIKVTDTLKLPFTLDSILFYYAVPKNESAEEHDFYLSPKKDENPINLKVGSSYKDLAGNPYKSKTGQSVKYLYLNSSLVYTSVSTIYVK